MLTLLYSDTIYHGFVKSATVADLGLIHVIVSDNA